MKSKLRLEQIKKIIASLVLGFLIVSQVLSSMNTMTVRAAEPVWPEAPSVSARNAILIEASTGTILYGKEETAKAYPASTTKLLTTLLAIERCPLSDVIEMSHDAIYSMGWDASRVGLLEGEELSLEDLLYAVMIASGNEACYAVAEHVGNDDIDEYLEIANTRVKELGCVNTNILNPHGLHDDNHYTCAYDLALIMKKCIEYTSFRRISNNHYYTIPPTNKMGERVMAQTHQILRKKIKYDGVFAGKTGHTDEAGQCLVTAAEREGMTLICVVLGEPDSTTVYDDTIALFDYGFDNFILYTPSGTEEGESSNAFPALFSDDIAFAKEAGGSHLSLQEATIIIPKYADFRDVINICELRQLSKLSQGPNLIGTAKFTYAGVTVGQTNIVYTSDTEEIIDAAKYYYETHYGTDDYSEEEYLALQGITPVREEEEKITDYRPVIMGAIIGMIIAVVGLIVVSLMYRRRSM